jgi:hypothetical protein
MYSMMLAGSIAFLILFTEIPMSALIRSSDVFFSDRVKANTLTNYRAHYCDSEKRSFYCRRAPLRFYTAQTHSGHRQRQPRLQLTAFSLAAFGPTGVIILIVSEPEMFSQEVDEDSHRWG